MNRAQEPTITTTLRITVSLNLNVSLLASALKKISPKSASARPTASTDHAKILKAKLSRIIGRQATGFTASASILNEVTAMMTPKIVRMAPAYVGK
jgi:hypothetical protein